MEISGEISINIIDKDIDFNHINHKISLSPTKIVRRGQVVVSNKTAPYDIWAYVQSFDQNNFNTVFDSLLNQLLAHLNEWLELQDMYQNIELNCYLRSDYGQMGLELSSEIMEKIIKLKLGLNIHILSYGQIK